MGDYFTHDFHQLSLPPGTTVEGAGGPGSAEGWERASQGGPPACFSAWSLIRGAGLRG